MTMVMTMVMKEHRMTTIPKNKLKATMLEVFRTIERTGLEVIVTDRNRPVLKISPYKEKQTVDELFKDIRGKAAFHEDPAKPTSREWKDI
jgi:antitoxin (DNA-binding transcriptional repressor) of toxin-antitoxin stability system